MDNAQKYFIKKSIQEFDFDIRSLRNYAVAQWGELVADEVITDIKEKLVKLLEKEHG
jgi:hypothetical protein